MNMKNLTYFEVNVDVNVDCAHPEFLRDEIIKVLLPRRPNFQLYINNAMQRNEMEQWD